MQIQHGMNARAYVPVSLQSERRKVGYGRCSLVKGTKTLAIKALYSGATTMRCYNSPCLSISRNIEFQTKSYAVIGVGYISVSIRAYLSTNRRWFTICSRENRQHGRKRIAVPGKYNVSQWEPSVRRMDDSD